MKDYCLTTVAFGEASAPFTAIRTLKQIAIDNELRHPTASEIINNESYVDDFHYGNNTIANTVHGRDELISILKPAGLELRKWASNDQAVLDGLPEYIITQDSSQRFMGLLWDSSAGEFSYPCGTLSVLTKRDLLTAIAKIYDPMGWIQPIIITAKILMQETWKNGLNWDDPLPEELMNKWTICRENLINIKSLTIPRWIKFSEDMDCIELHGFSDASQLAYGAVVYARFICSNKSVAVHQIIAKSRVAPAKVQLTIPRLELKGVLLLADLMEKVKQSMNLTHPTIYAWIDSQVALWWIKSPPNKWKPFVRHRVNAIQSMIPPESWNYVHTAENPADLVSRGCDVQSLQSSDLWVNPPGFPRMRILTTR